MEKGLVEIMFILSIISLHSCRLFLGLKKDITIQFTRSLKDSLEIGEMDLDSKSKISVISLKADLCSSSQTGLCACVCV